MAKGTRKQLRTARWQKATALLPLVVLSGALSANASSGDQDQVAATAATAQQRQRLASPAVPAEAFDQPASVALPDGPRGSGASAGLAPFSSFEFASGDAPGSSGGTSVNGIPAAALTAYQRAAAILNRADPGCNIDWSLIAGVGRVESDHGRYGGNALDDQGKAQPGIYGVPLNGADGTARIADTDGGALDSDGVYDRAVGPMQFIPSTWAVAGVDADQDGVKDPQDIDDAAAATAVYLCAGNDDLSTDAGKRAAVYRYNHSYEYVDLVLAIAASYAGGEYTAVPNGTPSSSTLVSREFAVTPDGKPARDPRNRASGGTSGADTRGGTASSGSVSGSGDDTSGGGGSSTGAEDGGLGDGTGGGGGNGTDGDGRGDGTGRENDKDDNDTPDTPDGGDAGDAVRDTVEKAKEPLDEATDPVREPAETLSRSAARSLCESKLTSLLAKPLIPACTNQTTGRTEQAALAIIDDMLAGL